MIGPEKRLQNIEALKKQFETALTQGVLTGNLTSASQIRARLDVQIQTVREQILPYPSFQIFVDYDQSIEELVDEDDYINCAWTINSTNFPCPGSGLQKTRIYLFDIQRLAQKQLKTPEIISEMSQRGFRPANIKELICLGLQLPHLEFPRIIALGSSWINRQDQVSRHAYLNEAYLERLVCLTTQSTWDSQWRFAAVLE